MRYLVFVNGSPLFETNHWGEVKVWANQAESVWRVFDRHKNKTVAESWCWTYH